MSKRYLPLAAVLVSVLLFVVAAAYYPGGTLESRDVVGYDWTRHTISTLFPPKALNGAPNPARYVAIPAMLILCVTVSVLFETLSKKSASKALQKTIEIGGIGSMVYAFLAVTTRMHDVLVTVSLVFFLAGAVATVIMLNGLRQARLTLFGMIALATVTAAAIMYYGNVLLVALPVAQKLAFVVCIAWLLATYASALGSDANFIVRTQ